MIGATGTRFDYGELSAGLGYDSGANLALDEAAILNLHAGDGRVAGAGNDDGSWRDVKAA